jgi:hypothetical protein
MKKNLRMALGALLLLTGGCEFGRETPVVDDPVLTAPVADESERISADAAEMRAMREKIDELESRLSSAETPPLPETQPAPEETAGPETAPAEPEPAEIVPFEPTPVPPERGAMLAEFQGEAPLHRLRPAGPTLGESCGKGATITGDNRAGRVTLGAGPSNFCKITFGASHPFAAAPVCTASPASTGCGGWITVGTTTADGFFLLSQDGTVNFEPECIVNYICVVSE